MPELINPVYDHKRKLIAAAKTKVNIIWESLPAVVCECEKTKIRFSTTKNNLCK